MSRFSKFRRNVGIVSSKQSSDIGHSTRRAIKYSRNVAYDHKSLNLKQSLNKQDENSPQDTKDKIKPFLVDLLRSNKPFKRINLRRLSSMEDGTDIDNVLSQTYVSDEFKDAVLAKFRKSDKMSLSLFQTIGILGQELQTLKDLLSQAALNRHTELSTATEKVFEIDLMTDSLVNQLDQLGIKAHFTSPAYIYIVDNSKEMNTILDMIRHMAKGINGGLRVVGLDVETAGSRKNHSSFPSILQLAISKDVVIIFQLYRLCCPKSEAAPNLHLIPDSLKKFLSSPSILKVGVNIRGDTQQLERYAGLEVKNSLCLQDMGNVLSLKRCSLQHLSHAYIGMHLEKGKGNYAWDSHKNVFSHRSAVYAANDVISSLLVFRKMLNLPKLGQKNHLVPKENGKSTHLTKPNEEQISNHTQFSVNIPRKFKSRPLYVDKTKYIEILRRLADVAQKNAVSFAKLERIILYTCVAFPKDDPLARIKTRKVIFYMVDQGILVRK